MLPQKILLVLHFRGKSSEPKKGVVTSVVIQCYWSVEIGRLNAINPHITLVGSKIWTCTMLFQLVGEKQFQTISCWKARRGHTNLTIELNTAEWEVLSSSPGQGEKLLFISFFISYVVLHGNTRRDLSYISRLSPRSYNSNALSIWGGSKKFRTFIISISKHWRLWAVSVYLDLPLQRYCSLAPLYVLLISSSRP